MTAFLYHFGPAYYSRVVRLALAELKIPFENQLIDLYQFGFDPADYLSINPQGTVPTLIVKDADVQLLTKSIDILIYLAMNPIPSTSQSTAQHAHVESAPPDLYLIKSSAMRQESMMELTEKLLNFPLDLFTYATIQSWPAFPKALIIKSINKNLEHCNEQLKLSEGSESTSTLDAFYTEKHRKNTKLLSAITQADELSKHEADLEALLEESENHLLASSTMYFFGEEPTFADIALFCLLTRIHELNYDSKYVGGGRRVRLGHLHSAFKQRPSYAVAIEKYSFVFGPRAVAFAGAKAILQKLTVIVGVLLMVAFVGKRLINQK